MLCEELKRLLLTFGRRIRIGAENELTGDGDYGGKGRRTQNDEWVRGNRKEKSAIQYNKTNDLGLLFCPEHTSTKFFRNTLSDYQIARCHIQEGANPRRHCRHNLITSQLWVQFCRCWWQCGLRRRSAADRLQESRVRIPLRAWMLCLVFVVRLAASATGLLLD